MATRAEVAARRAAVASLRREGKNGLEIAKKLDVPVHTIRRDARLVGLPLGSSQTVITDELISRGLELFADGCSRKEVAETLGTSYEVWGRLFPDLKWTRPQVMQHALDCSNASRRRWVKRRG